MFGLNEFIIDTGTKYPCPYCYTEVPELKLFEHVVETHPEDTYPVVFYTVYTVFDNGLDLPYLCCYARG